MQRPERSPWPLPVEQAAIIETHISTLFFVGDRVFKLHKPVQFGFLDFREREERRADCEREVMLNCRFAPDVYLGVADVVLDGGWPDAAPPYMWAHISFDPNGGLNYLHCSSPAITNLLGPGLATGSPQIFSKIGVLSVATGCWDNLVNQNDFMVAQPWLKGVAAAHVVTYPNSLNLFALSVG